MKFLALDLGRLTGWAVGGRVDAVVCGTATLCRTKDPRGVGFSALEDFIDTLTRIHGPIDMMVMEAPLTTQDTKHRNFLTYRALYGYAAIVEFYGARHGIPVEDVNNARIKKHFAGHGAADVDAMKARCRQLGTPVATEHEAIAVGALDWAIHTIGRKHDG